MDIAHSALVENDLDTTHAEIIAAGALPPLVAWLGAQSTAAVQVAAGTLMLLAVNKNNDVKIAEAGAIPPLVALLGAQSTAAVHSAAAGALWNLSYNANNRAKLVAAGAIPSLVALLSAHSTAAVQTVVAAEALQNLSGDSDSRVPAAGPVPPLVALLQEQAAGALRNLAFNTENRVSIAAAGAIAPLVALLGDQSTVEMQDNAVRALGELAKNADNQAAIKSDPRAFSSLAKLHNTSPSAAVRQAANGALQVVMGAPIGARGIQGEGAVKLAKEVVAVEGDKVAAKAATANMMGGETSMTAAKFSSMSASYTKAGPSQTDASQQAGPSVSASAPALPVSCTSAPASSVAVAMTPTAAASQQLPPPRPRKSCWSCGATGMPLKKCSVCTVAAYCGASCQKADWKAHKGQCAGLKGGASDRASSAAVGDK